ncbi:hypothetical protein GE300_20115 [Rhodobacteraceae bacterium 2CG4]|uniref:Uncharacterized protein n=1 Tax=Halovulum marinum TaxID=2662447 RepID=A0A6L5Z746_9RHOB|nr:hypothetical protein [Halovulum marinum]MSU91884.1 hypothetical protein [Halovulum marinum]
MSLLQTIRADALAARKAKAPEAGVLVTLIGEIDTKAKLRPAGSELTDDEVVAVVKKFGRKLPNASRSDCGSPASGTGRSNRSAIFESNAGRAASGTVSARSSRPFIV